MASESDPRPDTAELLAQAGFLRRLATELVVFPHDVDDLVQETYVRALEHPPQRAASLRSWLSVVARNLAFNSSRAQRRRDEHEARAARPESLEAGELALERLEQQKLLFELVLSLPEDQRTVLYLRYYAGLTPTAIAQRLRTPLKTIRSRQARALAALRERLDARNGGDGKSWRLALAPLVPLPPAPTAAPLLATLFGGLVMKKALVVVTLLLLALVGWISWRRLATAHPDRMGQASFEPVVQAAPASPAAPLPAEVLAQREEVESSTPDERAPKAPGRAEITLLWSDGAPAVGVGAAMELDRPRGAPPLRERAISDAQGTLKFEALALGKNRLAIDLRGGYWLDVPAGQTLRTTLTMRAGEFVRGRVLDERGQPVVDAHVVFECGDGWTPVIEAAARTDLAGEFSLRDIVSNGELGARAVGFLPSPLLCVQDLPARSGERQIEFRLVRGSGRLTGRVLAPDGAALAGALVLAGPRNGHIVPSPLGGNATAPQPRAAASDADGRFELGDALPAGPQPVHCFARGFAPWSGEVNIADAAEELVIQLAPAARIEGRVVDADGNPVAGAEVLQSIEHLGGWFHSDAFPAARDTTDAQGWFVLEWIGSGKRELNAWNQQRRELGRARATVECCPGETTRCELRLERGATISGRVVDEQGRPLAGWYVGSQPSDFRKQWYPRSASTDGEGRFLLANLGPGAHDLSVRPPALSAALVELKSVAPGTSELELVVPEAHAANAEVSGRLVASSPDQLAGFELTLWRVGQNEGHFLECDAGSGQFRGSAFPGKYRLEIKRNGASAAESLEIELRSGERTDLGDIVLAPIGTLELELTGLPPEELGRVRLRLSRPGANDMWPDNEQGRATAPALLAGGWTLHVADEELELSPSALEIHPGAPTRIQVEVRPKRR